MPAQPDGGRPTLWVGAAGTGTSFGLVRSIRAAWGDAVRIVISDTNPRELVASSAFADMYERVPAVTDPAFLDDIAGRLARIRPDVYFPILDEEIVAAARLRDAGAVPVEVSIHAPPTAVARLCLDKLDCAAWLADHGLPTPPTWLASQARWEGRPLIAKPRFGRGSLGVQAITSIDSLASIALDLDLVVQPACRRPECTVDAFISRDRGFRAAVCRERLEVKAGVCTKARMFADRELESLVLEIGTLLGLQGVFCVQMMLDPDDERRLVTDINPRPGAGTAMSSAAGMDLLAAGAADALGWPMHKYLRPLNRELYVVRQYAEFIVGPEDESS